MHSIVSNALLFASSMVVSPAVCAN